MFPSERFYHGLLVDAECIAAEVSGGKPGGVVSPVLNRMGIRPVAFFDIAHGVEVRMGKSLRNDAEVDFIAKFFALAGEKLRQNNLTVAVITPYKAQVRRLTEVLRSHSLAKSRSSRSEATGDGDGEDEGTDAVEINTVDGFQGREKDVVIFSCVRAGGGGRDRKLQQYSSAGSGAASHHSIGFVSDERRMNVALTRARKALIIVGSRRKLEQDSLWDSLLQSLGHRGLLMRGEDLHINSR